MSNIYINLLPNGGVVAGVLPYVKVYAPSASATMPDLNSDEQLIILLCRELGNRNVIVKAKEEAALRGAE